MQTVAVGRMPVPAVVCRLTRLPDRRHVLDVLLDQDHQVVVEDLFLLVGQGLEIVEDGLEPGPSLR